MFKSNSRVVASLCLASLALTSTAAVAQDDQAAGDDQQATSSGSEQQPMQEDTLVATVDGTEILGSDILTMIGLLPEQMRNQPMQMVVPLALDQLVLRELILEQARADNLAEDPEVQSQVEASTQSAEDDVMVGVWLDRELESRVTDEMVTETYEGLEAQSGQEMPPLEQLRPQIEQQLRQQALQQIRASLSGDAEIVLYGPDGQPLEQQSGEAMPQDQGEEGSETSGTDGASDSETSQ